MHLNLKKLSFLGVLGIVYFGLMMSPNTVMAQSSGITLIKAVGQVEVRGRQEASWMTAIDGRVLHPGNWLRTGVQSEAVVRFDSGSIHIYENTLLGIPASLENKTVSRSPEPLRNVILQKGHSLVKILKNRLNGRFEVITPNLIAGVKGTIFDVVDNDDLKGVFVSEGIVEVGSRQYPDEIVDITSNHFTLLINEHLSDIREMQAEIENLDDQMGDVIPNLGDAKNSPERPDLDYLIEKLEDIVRTDHRAEQVELKADLKAERAELKDEQTDLRNDLKAERAELKADLKAERADLKDDLKNERADLKDDLKNEQADLKDDLKNEQADLKDDLKNEQADLKDDLKNEQADLKDDLKNEQADLKDDLRVDNEELKDDLLAERDNLKNDRRTD